MLQTAQLNVDVLQCYAATDLRVRGSFNSSLLLRSCMNIKVKKGERHDVVWCGCFWYFVARVCVRFDCRMLTSS